ncbi:MAG: NADH-quinone oxidoreductase subunit NuoE [Gammaproteobacteria bacterium]|nr:NADH-quinone oxidoreductase subunit NuoE [Gammaproteobacteria bacterium]
MSASPTFASLVPEFDALRRRFPPGFESSLVLPCLRRLQEAWGHVEDSDIAALAEYLAVPRVQIEEALSFYGQLRREPVGRWHVEVCRNVSCSLRGAETLLERLSSKLGLAPGDTSADGRFTLSTCECLGSCGTAPVVLVNGVYHENASAPEIERMIEGLERA